MKVNFCQVMLGLDDKPLKESTLPDAQDSTAKMAVISALTNGLPGDEQLKDGAKHKLYRLAKRIKKSDGAMELSVEDLATIKARVATGFPPLVTGIIWDIIEGEAAEDEPAAALTGPAI